MPVKSHRFYNLVTFENGPCIVSRSQGRQLACKSRSEHVKHRLNLIEFAKGQKRQQCSINGPSVGRICRVAVLSIRGTGMEFGGRNEHQQLQLLPCLISRGGPFVPSRPKTGRCIGGEPPSCREDSEGVVSGFEVH